MKKRIIGGLLLTLSTFLVLCASSCGDNTTQILAHTHTHSKWDIVTESTCETLGIETSTCSCGHIETRPIPAIGHTFGSWTTITEAACETIGMEKRTCACGYYELRNLSALGHQFTNWNTILEATCETTGTEKRTCDCGYYETRSILPVGHTYKTTYTHDHTHHWHESTCEHSELKKDIEEHSYTLGVCKCGDTNFNNNIKVDVIVDGELYDSVYTDKGNNYLITPPVMQANTTGNPNSENYFFGWYVDENFNTPLTDSTVFKEDSKIYGKWITAYTYEFEYEIYNGQAIITSILDKTAKVIVIPAYINSYPVYGINDSAFDEHILLKTVIICNGVQVIGSGAFAECTGVETVVLPESITTIESSAFEDCLSLKNITLPNQLTSISSNLFTNCQSLTAINIPKNIMSIGKHAFENTYALTDLYYNAINCANFDSNNYTFYNAGKNSTTGLTVHVGKDVEYIPSYAFYPYSSSYYPNIKTVDFENNTTLEIIGSYAFAYCQSLSKINLPDSVTSIGDHAFAYCQSLTEITLPDNLTTISSYAFNNCGKLANISLPSKLTYIDAYAFQNCSLLTKITIPSSVIKIGQYAFSGCTLLTNVDFQKTSGWWYSSYSYATSGTSFTTSDISTNATAATYLKSTYAQYYWYRGA